MEKRCLFLYLFIYYSCLQLAFFCFMVFRIYGYLDLASSFVLNLTKISNILILVLFYFEK